jgi:predicted CXXCH cytochrome family protein
MRVRLFFVIGVLAFLCLPAGVVLAGGGPHGGYTPTTDACAGCHRAKTALGPRLLVQASTYALCVSCHGSAGAGANTNVEDGFYLATRDDSGADGNVGAANTPDNAPLSGGGFVNYGGVAVTSSHDPTGATAAAWGNGGVRGVTADLSAGNLSCASCHDPHGSLNYRSMKSTVNGSAVTAAQVDEGAAKDYDTESWGAGISTICAACHGAYYQTAAGTGSDPGMVASGGYTHRIDMPWNGDAGTDPLIGMGTDNPETAGLGGFTLPLAETGVDHTVVCMTCHLPHGTSATMAGLADPAYDPPGPLAPIAAGDSSLLRLDNRGVCQVCHQKGAGGPHGNYIATTDACAGCHRAHTAPRPRLSGNVPPSVALSGPDSAKEGDTKSYGFTTTDPDADTFTLESQSCGANGTLSNPAFNSETGDGSFDCTFPDGPTSSTVSVQVADSNGALSNVGTVVVSISNEAPQVVAPADQVATEGTSTLFVLGSFSDAGLNDGAWQVQVDWGDGSPLPPLVPVASQGTLPGEAHTYPQGVYAVIVTVSDKDGGTGNASFQVTVANLPPNVEADPTSQTVQYSDHICDVTFTATDVAGDVMTEESSHNKNGGGWLPGLPSGLTLTACIDDVLKESCSWTLSGQASVPVGTYTVRLTVTDDDGESGFADTTITVLHEDADIWLKSDNPVAVEVATEGGNSGQFSLTAYVQETNSPDSAVCAADYGDIGNAGVSISLVPVGPGGGPPEACSQVIVAGSGYGAVGQVECSFDNVEVNTYHVQASVVGSYYTAGPAEDVLVVYDPSLGFTTGGGWFYWPGTDEKTSFGYTMKYGKRGRKPKGSLLLIRHVDEDAIYRVKSNALYALALGHLKEDGETIGGWASFSGKATYSEPGEETAGNHDFVVYAEDRGQPGAGVDKFWFEIRDGADVIVDAMSMDREATEYAKVLEGGNIVVPHGGGKKEDEASGVR